MKGTKHLDFLDFSEIAEIMYNKKHLTAEGFNPMMIHYLQMNTKRKNFPDGFGLSIENWREKDIEYLTLNGHYINGFLAGDGSIGLITNLNNISTFGTILISFTQHVNNYVLIASVLRYFSPNLNPSKHSEFSVGGSIRGTRNWDKYLAPHFIEFPMLGHKQIAISNLFQIRPLLDDKNNKQTQQNILDL